MVGKMPGFKKTSESIWNRANPRTPYLKWKVTRHGARLILNRLFRFVGELTTFVWILSWGVMKEIGPCFASYVIFDLG